MEFFKDLDSLRAKCRLLPSSDDLAASTVTQREQQLTKPRGSLGKLEDLVLWLAQWQGRSEPRLDRVEVLIFAGAHGVTAHRVSAYPAEVTAQMVTNFQRGGAAINQLARFASAELRIIPIELDNPTADLSERPAMSHKEFLSAVAIGYNAVQPQVDLLCLGEMGIGNTTAAAALCAALFGGNGKQWSGRGTGVDDAGLRRKHAAIDRALRCHSESVSDPFACAAAFGGRELAAILGATLAARHRRVPVLLDGFICTAAVAPLIKIGANTLEHAVAGHVSSEKGHRILLDMLGLTPILDLGMRLGEASGATLAVSIIRAALACHLGMSTFSDAGVSEKEEREPQRSAQSRLFRSDLST